jgi:hypothetical protein
MSFIVAESAMCVWSRLDVQDVFSKLGYFPTLRRSQQRWTLRRNERSADAKDADKVIALICAVPLTASCAQKTWAPEKKKDAIAAGVQGRSRASGPMDKYLSFSCSLFSQQ